MKHYIYDRWGSGKVVASDMGRSKAHKLATTMNTLTTHNGFSGNGLHVAVGGWLRLWPRYEAREKRKRK